ncbi:hypothetical protein J4573_33165 [Actinomadura barringtoniae]|uniref:Uncharacterized protein n=1 Tax=Actinomadura barringtoniae TaxID=1427535 RepID=A0A939PGS3_9ACTN|nr:hypothetical protein [Actinomadura barringtoniae]MBO2451978.1 hypothetical protein [Actinomadura barringtoniae]
MPATPTIEPSHTRPRLPARAPSTTIPPRTTSANPAERMNGLDWSASRASSPDGMPVNRNRTGSRYGFIPPSHGRKALIIIATPAASARKRPSVRT